MVAALLCGCAGVPLADSGIPASGRIAGQPFSARVDAEIARYYLEDFPRPHPRGWHEALAALEARLPAGVVADGDLARIGERYGSTDLAALVFIRRVLADPDNRALARCVEALDRALADPNAGVLPGTGAGRFTVLFAPGWLYRSNPQTEADFARTRAALDRVGVPYRFLATPEDATVEENARLLAATIRELPAGARPVIVVSASKSAAEAAWALGHLLEPGQAAPVAAWINAGGTPAGTPLADHWTRFPRSLLARAAFLRHGWRYDSLLSLRTGQSRERLARVTLPPDLVVINYIAVPMASQVTPEARGRYRLLSAHGPNDGMTPLASAAMPGGITLVEPGADHYFLSVDIGRRTLALTAAVRRYLDDEPCP